MERQPIGRMASGSFRRIRTYVHWTLVMIAWMEGFACINSLF